MLSLRFFIVAFGLCFAVVATESSESESNESVEKPGFFGRLMQGAGINWLQGSHNRDARSAEEIHPALNPLRKASTFQQAGNADEIRQRFLERIGGKQKFAWVKKFAEKANRKKQGGRPFGIRNQTPDDIIKAVRELEFNGAHDEKKLGGLLPTITNINKAAGLADVLVAGDLLLTEDQAKQRGIISDSDDDSSEESTGARQKRKVVWDPQQKWPTNQPISYYFDGSVDTATRDLIRYTLKWWTERTCLEWKENGSTTPRVKFIAGEGCYSGAGRYYWDKEQEISIGRGCEYFATVAHEAAHTLGFFHEQNRPDRDGAIQVVMENVAPGWEYQFEVQKQSLTYSSPYDYGSTMHYGGYDGDKIVMKAKEKGYQHTMGNEYGPLFYDVKVINQHHKCYDKCTATKCKNSGIPHPRDCSKCICPEGFAGKDCGERAPGEGGAPATCGKTVNATSTWQTLTGDVTAGPGQGKWGLPLRHACCFYHIKAPSGKKVEVKFNSVSGQCLNTCYYGATEIKFKDLARGGARLCCASHLSELGTVQTSADLAVVSVCSQYAKQGFSLQYRMV
ncbi:CBN-NAS-31 protein [Aphelenchoides avenae]|nr:CBN-NAS-31 protein [Aphelenchus avenae]